jgi:hypothetical protein
VGLFRIEIYDYPEDVFQEALLNALSHRDYSSLGAVYVKHYPDKIVIENPGTFLDGITPENIITHQSVARNKLIAETLQRLRYVQRTGQGVDIIYKEMASMGKPYPEYMVYDDAVALTLQNTVEDVEYVRFIVKEQNTQQQNFSLREMMIIRYVYENGKIRLAKAKSVSQGLEEEVKKLRKELNTTRVGTVLDTCHAMITAKYAGKQGRDIFSIPGNVGELNSIGTNRLLKKGAKIVTGALDMLEEYEYIYPHRIRIENLPAFMPKFSSGSGSVPKVSANKKPITSKAQKSTDFTVDNSSSESLPFTEEIEQTAKAKKSSENTAKEAPKKDTSSLNDNEKKIYDLFPDGAGISADEIARTGIPVGIVLQNLTMLEIKGFIKTLPGGMFIKA